MSKNNHANLKSTRLQWIIFGCLALILITPRIRDRFRYTLHLRVEVPESKYTLEFYANEGYNQKHIAMTIPDDENGHPAIVRLAALEGAITNIPTVKFTSETENLTIHPGIKNGERISSNYATITLEGAFTQSNAHTKPITWLENGNKGYISWMGLVEFDGRDWIGVETKPARILWRGKNAIYAF